LVMMPAAGLVGKQVSCQRSRFEIAKAVALGKYEVSYRVKLPGERNEALKLDALGRPTDEELLDLLFAIGEPAGPEVKTRKDLREAAATGLERARKKQKAWTKLDDDYAALLAADSANAAWLRVHWWTGEEREIVNAATSLERPGKSGGYFEGEYYDPSAMACELYAISTGVVDDYRVLDGSLLYIVGIPSLFWSAVINFRHTESVAPFIPTRTTGGLNWGDAKPVKAARRLWRKDEPPSSPLVSRQHALRQKKKQDSSTTSQALILMTRCLQPEALGGFKRAGVSVPQTLRRVPWMKGVVDEGDVTSEMPPWWREAVEPWDDVFRAGLATPVATPCMFYATKCGAGGLGCLSGDTCAFRHDRGWYDMDLDLRKHPRACYACSVFADRRCIVCNGPFFCGECPETLGRTRCPACDDQAAARDGDDDDQDDDARTRAAATYYGQTLGTQSSRVPREDDDDDGDSRGRLRATTPPSCGYCGKVEGSLRRCSRCRNTRFCSTECQRLAWPAHKKVCEALKRVTEKNRELRRRENPRREQLTVITDATGVGAVGVAIGGGQQKTVSVTFVTFVPGVAVPPVMQLESVASCRDPVVKFFLACGPCADLELAKAALDDICRRGVEATDLRVPGAGFTCLEWAARKGNFDVASWLCDDPRTAPLVNIGAPVAWACYTNRVELARMLVDKGADSRATDDTLFNSQPPLLVAAANGQLLAMKFLVDDLHHDIRQVSRPGQGVLYAINSARVDVDPSNTSDFLDAMSSDLSPEQEAQLHQQVTATTSGPPGKLPENFAACAAWARNKGAVC